MNSYLWIIKLIESTVNLDGLFLQYWQSNRVWYDKKSSRKY